MKIRISRLFLRLLFLTVSLLYISGCARQMKSVQSEPLVEQTGNGEIKSIQFSDDASMVEISTDRPLVYTYYMLDTPPRLIVDLAQTTSGGLILPIDINRGNIKRIDIARHEFGKGVLSRLEIALNEKVDVTATLDSQSNKKLIITLPPVKGGVKKVQEKGESGLPEPFVTAKAAVVASEPAQIAAAPSVPVTTVIPSTADKAPMAEEKPLPIPNPPAEQIVAPVAVSDPQPAVIAPAQPQPEPEPEPQPTAQPKPVSLPPGSPRSLTAITKGVESINIDISSPVQSFKAFRLSQPERVVIDIANTKNLIASKQVDIGKFSLLKARIGGTAEKLRVVFDAADGTIPAHQVIKSDNGLQIVFGENARKAAVANELLPVEKGMAAPPVTEPAVVIAAIPPAAPTPVSLQEAPPVVAPEAPVEKVTAPATEPTLPSTPKDQVVTEKIAKMIEPPPVVEPAAPPAPLPPAAPVPVVAPVPILIPASAPSEPVSKVVSKTSPPPSTGAGTVDAIEFTRSEDFSQVTVSTSGRCTATQPTRSAKAVLFTLKGCRLPAKLQRSLDTTGFNSVVKEVAPVPVKTKKGYETRIAVKTKTSAPYILKQEGNSWLIEFREPAKPVKITRPVKTLKPLPAPIAVKRPASVSSDLSAGIDREFSESRSETVKAKKETPLEEELALGKGSAPIMKAAKGYTGRKVSLEFSDADIRKIFQLLAEVSNQNFLISDDVSGTISLKLVNVPWDQALDVILENKGLGMQKDGNIVQIRPKTKIKSLDDEAVESRISSEKKMPLTTEIFDINFATLGDIKTQFVNLKSRRPDSSITSDIRTNKIIVVDIEPNIKKMKSLLASLDVPEKQVMIEARIVEASSSFARDIGVKWNFGYQDGSASVANINNITGSMGGIVSGTLPTATTGGLAAGVSFGKLLSNIQLDMRLSAAATVGQVKIISTPRVLTVNNKPAKISQGQMVPYQNTSSTEGAKTEFIEAALSLEVTPHITADGSVNMKIKASNNSIGTGSPPAINKKEATTELVVKNGETTVIGGIYVDSETEGDTGIPYLSDIPLMGWLFKSNAKVKSKNELLIFITPKIMI